MSEYNIAIEFTQDELKFLTRIVAATPNEYSSQAGVPAVVAKQLCFILSAAYADVFRDDPHAD